MLDAGEVRQFRERLAAATWQDGLATAGSLARAVKRNEQLPDSCETAVSLGKHLLRKLGPHPLFVCSIRRAVCIA